MPTPHSGIWETLAWSIDQEIVDRDVLSENEPSFPAAAHISLSKVPKLLRILGWAAVALFTGAAFLYLGTSFNLDRQQLHRALAIGLLVIILSTFIGVALSQGPSKRDLLIRRRRVHFLKPTAPLSGTSEDARAQATARIRLGLVERRAYWSQRLSRLSIRKRLAFAQHRYWWMGLMPVTYLVLPCARYMGYDLTA